MRFTMDALGLAMTAAPMLLVVLVVIAMLRERDAEKTKDEARAEAKAAKVAARKERASVPVDADTVGTLEAPSNN